MFAIIVYSNEVDIHKICWHNYVIALNLFEIVKIKAGVKAVSYSAICLLFLADISSVQFVYNSPRSLL